MNADTYRAFIDSIYMDVEEARRLANQHNDYMAVLRSGVRHEIMPLVLAEKSAAMDDGEIVAVAAPGLDIDQVLQEVWG